MRRVGVLLFAVLFASSFAFAVNPASAADGEDDSPYTNYVAADFYSYLSGVYFYQAYYLDEATQTFCWYAYYGADAYVANGSSAWTNTASYGWSQAGYSAGAVSFWACGNYSAGGPHLKSFDR